MRKPEKMEELLHAAHQVVMRGGVPKLTLDLVAREAGVSKGAVLYYFPTKNALVSALITFSKDSNIAAWQEKIAQEPAGPGRATRALLKAHGYAPDDIEEHRAAGILPAILEAVASDPELLETMRTRNSEEEEILLNDGLDRTTSLVIRLVLDGLKFNDLTGISPPSAEARRDVVDWLLRLATPVESNIPSVEARREVIDWLLRLATNYPDSTESA